MQSFRQHKTITEMCCNYIKQNVSTYFLLLLRFVTHDFIVLKSLSREVLAKMKVVLVNLNISI